MDRPPRGPRGLMSFDRDAAGAHPHSGRSGWSCPAFPSARARVWGRLQRGEAGPHHLKERQGPPNYRAARGGSREGPGMPRPGDQRSVLRYPRVPRLPEMLGFPEVPDWLTEPRLAGPLPLERFCSPA